MRDERESLQTTTNKQTNKTNAAPLCLSRVCVRLDDAAVAHCCLCVCLIAAKWEMLLPNQESGALLGFDLKAVFLLLFFFFLFLFAFIKACERDPWQSCTCLVRFVGRAGFQRARCSARGKLFMGLAGTCFAVLEMAEHTLTRQQTTAP